MSDLEHINELNALRIARSLAEAIATTWTTIDTDKEA